MNTCLKMAYIQRIPQHYYKQDLLPCTHQIISSSVKAKARPPKKRKVT